MKNIYLSLKVNDENMLVVKAENGGLVDVQGFTDIKYFEEVTLLKFILADFFGKYEESLKGVYHAERN